MTEEQKNERTIRTVRRVLTVCVAAGFIIYLIVTRQTAVITRFDNDSLSISYGEQVSVSIPFNEIISVTLTDALDTGTPVAAVTDARVSAGTWHSDVFGDYTLFVYMNVQQLIIVESEQGYCAFNLSNANDTKLFYEALLTSVNAGE